MILFSSFLSGYFYITYNRPTWKKKVEKYTEKMISELFVVPNVNVTVLLRFHLSLWLFKQFEGFYIAYFLKIGLSSRGRK